MGRPDFSLLARQQRGIADTVGETGTWFRFVSADAPAPMSEAVGYGASSRYVGYIVTGLLAPVPFEEIYQAGGTLIAGDVRATLIDALPSPEDYMIWRGVSYTVIGTPLQQQILQRSAYRMILRRGQPTGG
jgi:hypothetical protein